MKKFVKEVRLQQFIIHGCKEHALLDNRVDQIGKFGSKCGVVGHVVHMVRVDQGWKVCRVDLSWDKFRIVPAEKKIIFESMIFINSLLRRFNSLFTYSASNKIIVFKDHKVKGGAQKFTIAA